MIKLRSSTGTKTSLLCPKGDFGAVCTAVYDLGLQRGFDGKEAIRKYAILFEVDEPIIGGNLNGQRYRLSRIVAEWFSSNSALTEVIKAMFEDTPTVEIDGERYFDEQALVGRSCVVRIEHDFRDGNTYARIASASKHPEGPAAVSIQKQPSSPPMWVQRMKDKALEDNTSPASNEPQPAPTSAPQAQDASEQEMVTTTTATGLLLAPGDEEEFKVDLFDV